jgi:hypothetical protein
MGQGSTAEDARSPPSGKSSKALEKEQLGLCSFLDMVFRELLFQALG